MLYGYMKREPIYPLFLAIILRLTGGLGPGVLCFFQTSLALVSCYLLYKIGDEVFGPTTGRLASLIYALHPLSFWYSTRFSSEAVAIPTMLLSILLIEGFFYEPTRGRAAMAGLAVGLAALSRSACVMLLPAIVLFAMVKLVKWPIKLRPLLSYVFVLLLCYGGVQSVWLLRNYAISGEIVPFTTVSGSVFFLGNQAVERFDPRTQTAGFIPDEIAKALYVSVQNEIAMGSPEMPLPRLEAKTDQHLLAMARRFSLRTRCSWCANL